MNIVSGPWKFGGLPGLIIKVGDVDNMFQFELTNVLAQTKLVVEIKIPEVYKGEIPISHKDYIIKRDVYN